MPETRRSLQSLSLAKVKERPETALAFFKMIDYQGAMQNCPAALTATFLFSKAAKRCSR